MGTKFCKKIVAIICILAMILPISSEVLAKITQTAAGQKQTFGITLLHQSKTLDKKKDVTFGYSTDTGARNSYRLYSGNNDFETTILCLDKDKRFPQENGIPTGEYTSQGNASRDNLNNANSSIGELETKQIQWLIRNAIIPEDSEDLKEQKLSKIFNRLMSESSTTSNPLTLADIKSILTEDDLVFALQFTIWEITNGIKVGGLQGTNDGINWDGLTGNDRWGYKGKKGDYIIEIINYYNTQLAGNLEEDTTTKGSPIFENQPVETTVEGAYAFVGPFRIASGTNYYSVDVIFSDAAGQALSNMNYLLVDKPTNNGATVLPQTKESLQGKDFYVRVRTNTTARKVQFKLTTQVQTSKAEGTVWTPESNENQPVLSIEREEIPGEVITYEKPFDIVITTQYDASLRKYISKIKRKTTTGSWKIVWDPENGVGTGSRVPNGPYEATGENPFNQYDYKHRKEPLEVQVGDRIEYTLVVTNECDENLIVNNITDYLPPSGISYVSDDTINTNNGWVYNSSSRSVVTDKTSATVLAPKRNTQVSIVCEVTENAVGKVVTNIAEITQISDETGKVVTDIDSVPDNIQLPSSDKDWQNYKGNETNEYGNKSDLTDSDYYYNGQEDDDDFEKIVVPGTIDLALRKSIVTVNGTPKDRQRVPDTTPLRDGDDTTTTSNFTDIKTPVQIKAGDVVVYTIRVFNEGQEDAYVGAIEDYIPEGLGFLPQHKLNISNGWIAAEGSTSIKLSQIKNATKNLSQSDFISSVTDYKNTDVVKGRATIKTTKLKDTKLNSYDSVNDNLTKAEVQIACVVLDTVPVNTIIKNISAITEYKNSKGEVITDDIDSDTTEPINPDTYPDNDHIQDDDDFEKLILTESAYDLALKKYITGVASADGTSKTIPEDQKRYIEVTDTTALVNRNGDEKLDAVYKLNKKPVEVSKGDYVTYTIRIFNEGLEDGKVEEIVDSVPDGLQFVPYETNSDGTYKSGSNVNYKYGWKTFNEQTVTTGWQEGIKTTYLKDTIIPAFDKNQTTNPDNKVEKGLSYVDVQVEFKVVTDEHIELKNIAEITKDDGDDNDSTPDNKDPEEDDEDYDVVIPQKFDLALRKFITQIGKQEVTDRIPQVTYKDGKFKYEHTKEPRIVVKGQTVVYTIRVYNEGSKDGYAAEIKDDMPAGIIFLPDHEINKKYGWEMYDESGNKTEDVSLAKTIRTPYLSKEESDKRGEDNLLLAFDNTKPISETNPSYRDVQVAFEVTQENVTGENRVIINTAEISKDQDKDGKEIDDSDSTPDNDEPEEDDIDKEYIELKYFDLALLKYVSKVIVTEDGVVKETETGYDGTENPEPVVKVELNKKKLNKTEVKYVYSIKITNEGEIEGYATEVSDRIPQGLAFFAEDNTEFGWKVKEDGTVATDYLKDTLLKPGESAVIQIVLRWERSESNLGQKVNVAEITDDDNEYDVPDIDSTPNNNKDGEDDQDEAIVVLSINTGSTPMYILIISGIIALIGTGGYLIYKNVIRK